MSVAVDRWEPPRAAPAAPRLVQACKSPTRQPRAPQGAPGLVCWGPVDTATGETARAATAAPNPLPGPVTSGGTAARLCYRDWSDEWRLRCETETPMEPPPAQAGDRITHQLSDRGARAIAESCEFVAIEQGGYTTFGTATADPARRERIATRRTVPQTVTYLAGVHRFAVLAPSLAHLTASRDLGPGGTLPARPPTRELVDQTIEAAGPFCRVVWEWVSSLQREASRFFEALSRMYARGWVPEYARAPERTGKDGARYTPIRWNRPRPRPITRRTREGAPYTVIRCGPRSGLFVPLKWDRREKLPPAGALGDSLAYAWVAENPENADGERNPHLHFLIRWRVPWAVFPCWARRIERLWGGGFVHLEKLKARQAAGYYIAKAAGYLSKANGASDQGPVRGNRYGVSAMARAPGWVAVTSWAWHIMARCLDKARALWKRRAAPLQAERDRAVAAMKRKDTDATARRRIAAALTRVRGKLRGLGGWVGKYQITVRGVDRMDKFLCWAEREGWEPTAKPRGLWRTLYDRARDAADTARRFFASQWGPENWAHLLADADRYEPIGAADP